MTLTGWPYPDREATRHEHALHTDLYLGAPMPRKKTPPVDPDNPPPPEIATEDILIPRPDLGPGAYTLIARKGDPIPTD